MTEVVIIDRYTGPKTLEKHGRTLKAIESGFFRSVDLDVILRDLAKELPEGSTFSLLDVGSGIGTFLLSLTDTVQAPGFQHIVSDKKLSVRALGLTDGQDASLFNKPDPEFRKKVEETGAKYDLDNYIYFITASQSLEAFLKDKDVREFTFMMASQSLMYLSARVFAATLDTMISRLAPGGKILVWGVGSDRGPLPAFLMVNAEALRGEVTSQEVQDLNLFFQSAESSEYTALIALRDDWWELRNRLEKLVIKLERAGFISREDLRGKVDSSFYYFKQRKRDVRAYIKDALSGFRMVDDNDAKKIIELYHLLHGALEKMKKKQYQKQIAGKQAYLVGLKTRENLSMRVLQESSSSGIQAFLLTKTS